VKLSLLMIAIMKDESSTMMITITIHNGSFLFCTEKPISMKDGLRQIAHLTLWGLPQSHHHQERMPS
jgi:hypothetical protein